MKICSQDLPWPGSPMTNLRVFRLGLCFSFLLISLGLTDVEVEVPAESAGGWGLDNFFE